MAGERNESITGLAGAFLRFGAGRLARLRAVVANGVNALEARLPDDSAYAYLRALDPSIDDDLVTLRALKAAFGGNLATSTRLVRAAATGNVNIATGGAQTLDNVLIGTDDLALLAWQTNPAENGIYRGNASGAWTRAGTLTPGMLIPVGEGTSWGGNIFVFRTPSGFVLGNTALQFRPLRPSLNNIEYFDDFIGSTTAFSLNWATSTSGTAAAVASAAASAAMADRPGQVVISSGTTTTGRAQLSLSTAQLSLPPVGGGLVQYETTLQLSALATTTDDYNIQVGLFDISTGTGLPGSTANHLTLRYNRSASANWQISVRKAGTETITTTSVAVVAGGVLKMRMVSNQAGDIEFYLSTSNTLEYVLIGTVAAANLPTAAMLWLYRMTKTAGTTNVSLTSDYLRIRYVLPGNAVNGR